MSLSKSPEEILILLESRVAHERALGLKLIGKMRYYSMSDICIQFLEDRSREVREFAAWALDQIASPEAVPYLIRALHDPAFGVRSNAGWALIHIAHRTLPNVVVPDVIDVLQGPDENAQQMAYLVLHHIGGETARAAIRRYWRR